MLFLPSMDTLPPTFLDVAFHEEETPGEEWVHLLSPLLYIFGAAVAYWGSALLRLVIRLISLVLAPLHRYRGSFKHLKLADCLFVRLSFNSFHLQAVCLQRLWHPAAANPAPHRAVSDCYGRDFLWGVVDICLLPVPPL